MTELVYYYHMSAGIILAELLVLYVISRRLTQNLYVSLYLLTRSRPASISILSVLFFPGTVIHELAHLFTAEILGVRTSGLTLVPEGLEEKSVKTGSVMIAQTDPIRRAAIGIAPVITGLLTLAGLSFYLMTIISGTPTGTPPGNFLPNPQPETAGNFLTNIISLLQSPSWWIPAAVFFGLFIVSNTMFSSPEDLEGFWPVVIVMLLVGVAAYIAGLRLTLTGPVLDVTLRFLDTMAKSLGFVTMLNLLLYAGTVGLIRLTERITKRRLIVKP